MADERDHTPRREPDTEDSSDSDKSNSLEIAGAVLLGIAAVLIAWTTYQAGLWGGVQDTRNTASALSIVDAADDLGRGDATASLDQLLFVDWILRPVGDEADLLFGQMSPEGQLASTQWLQNDAIRPFDSDEYVFSIYGEGLAKRESAFGLFDAAAEANQNGDDYTLAATIVALVLFLAGVSLVLKGHRTRLTLVVSSGVILAGVAIYALGLPQAGGAESVEEIEAALTDEALADFAATPDTSAPDPPADDAAPGVGDTAFAVYLDFVPESTASDDPRDDFAEIIESADEIGYTVVVGPLSCDEGAGDQLQIFDEVYAAAVYFETFDEASAFAAETLEGGDESDVIEVRILC